MVSHLTDGVTIGPRVKGRMRESSPSGPSPCLVSDGAARHRIGGRAARRWTWKQLAEAEGTARRQPTFCPSAAAARRLAADGRLKSDSRSRRARPGPSDCLVGVDCRRTGWHASRRDGIERLASRKKRHCARMAGLRRAEGERWARLPVRPSVGRLAWPGVAWPGWQAV